MKPSHFAKRLIALALTALLAVSAGAQNQTAKPDDEPVIRISTELVQLDVVVTDKNGRVVKNLSKDDFIISEVGKRQQVSFFQFVDAAGGKVVTAPTAVPEAQKRQGLTEADVRRVFAFVVDDLTIRYEDLKDLRQMLTDFVDQRMQDNDLVAIIRTVGGKGLLQQFTSDKELLRRAIASLTATTHPFSVFHNPQGERLTQEFLTPAGGGGESPAVSGGAVDAAGETIDIDNPFEDTNKTLRAYMTLGTAAFVIDSLKQLPGRKTMVLVSGGFPLLSATPGTTSSAIAAYFQDLTDRATRSGVAINTFDTRGLQATGVASFEDTPGKSSLGGATAGFGRQPDESLLGSKNPIDTFENQQGLRVLAADTGGIAVLNKNNFREALDKILNASEAYYILAYTPIDQNFKGDFRKLEIKVKGDYKVYSRKGYLAREDKPAAAPVTKQEQILTAIKSPLAKRDIDLDAVVMYKAADAPNKGNLEINLSIDTKKLGFEQDGDKHKADFDIAGFVYDELGKLRGGFSETALPALSQEEYDRSIKSGFSYSANTTVPAGAYQVRVAVRDNKTGKIGTLSRFMEVPNLAKGRLAASTMALGAVPPSDMKTPPVPLTATRQISRKQDLRYAVLLYNAKEKDKKPQIKTQLAISQNGKMIFQEPEEMLAASSATGLVKVGQIGMSVKPGRYTLTLIITDLLADKKAQTITRSMDFVVVN